MRTTGRYALELRAWQHVLALAVCLAAAACAAQPETTQPGALNLDNAAGLTGAPTAAAFPLPAPSQIYNSLRGVKQVSSLLIRDASDYAEGYSQRALPQAPELILGPAWESGYSAFDTVAFAVYRFDLTARTGRLGLHTQFSMPPGDWTRLWLGTSNWGKDRWDWYSGTPGGEPALPDTAMDTYKHPQSSELYVAVVLLGQSAAMLRKVWLTCSLRGDWWMYGRNAAHQARSPFKGPDYPSVLWSKQFPTQSPYGHGDVGSPVYDANGIIYVAAQRAELATWELYALHPDGTEAWMRTLDNTIPSGGAYFGLVGASAAIDNDGTIYASPNIGALTAFSPNGNVKWSFAGNDYAAPFPAMGPNGAIYTISYDDATAQYYFHALSNDGSQQWQQLFGSVPHIGLPGVAADGTIYTCYDEALYSLSSDGAVQWMYQAGASVAGSMPGIDSSGKVYFTSGEPRLYVLNADGTPAQSWLLPAHAENGAVVVGADGAVYVTCADGGLPDSRLYAFNPDGTLRWSYPTGGRGTVSLDAAGTVYVAGRDSRLYAINPDGTLKWWFVATYSITGSPVFAENGSIYIVDTGGLMYAIGPGSQLPEHTASGYVRDGGGIGLAGVAVTVSNEEPVQTDAAGYWSKRGLADGTYLVSPSLDGYRFGPALAIATVAGGDTTVPDFTGELVAPPVWQMEGGNRQHTRLSPYTGPADATQAWSVWLEGVSFKTEPLIRGDGALVMQSCYGDVYQYSPDGTQLWQCAIGLPSIARFRWPTLALDGTVYCTTNATPQSILYIVSPGGSVASAVAPWIHGFLGSPVLTTEGTLLFGDYGGVIALRPDGTQLWYAAIDGADSTPAIAPDGTIIRGGGEYLWALHPDGTEKWTCAVESGVVGHANTFTTPAIADDGTIYVGDYRKFYAINPDGTVKWSFRTGDTKDDNIRHAPALGPDGSVYFTTVKLYAFSADGAPLWEYFPGGYGQSAAPTVDAAGAVYSCIGGLGALHALNPDGTLKWEFDTMADIGGVSIGADGTLYFGNDVGYIHALGPGGG